MQVVRHQRGQLGGFVAGKGEALRRFAGGEFQRQDGGQGDERAGGFHVSGYLGIR